MLCAMMLLLSLPCTYTDEIYLYSLLCCIIFWFGYTLFSSLELLLWTENITTQASLCLINLWFEQAVFCSKLISLLGLYSYYISGSCLLLLLLFKKKKENISKKVVTALKSKKSSCSFCPFICDVFWFDASEKRDFMSE